MSGYIPAADSLLPLKLDEPQDGGAVPVLFCHGDADQMVDVASADASLKFLKDNFPDQFATDMHIFKGMGHEACLEEVEVVSKWLQKHLPRPGSAKSKL